MAAKRFVRSSIDWAAFAERVPGTEKGKFLQFKAKTDNYAKNMMSYAEKPPTIDWAQYRSRISPALVDDFEKKYNAIKVSYPEDKLSSEIDEQQKMTQQRVKEFNELSDLRIKLRERELEWWKNMMPFEIMTKEEYRDYFPDLAYDPINRPSFWPHDEPPKPVFPYRR